jgi:hypothetical protein
MNRSTRTTLTPRVQATNETQIVNIEPPTPRVHTKSIKELSPQRIKLHSYIHKAITNRARLPQLYNRQLRQQEQRESVQLIHDHDTVKYFNYQQLIRDPKILKTMVEIISEQIWKISPRSW